MESQTLTIRNQGVQIILNRMHSHPEEFVSNKKFANTETDKWSWVMEKVTTRIDHKHETSNGLRLPLPFLSNEEVEALYDKYMSIQGEAFTHRVMRQLLEDSDEESNNVRFSTEARMQISTVR